MNMLNVFRKKPEPILRHTPVKMHTCSSLLLCNYITCQVDGVLDSLVIQGEASEMDKALAWQHINEEFYDLSANKQATYELTLCAELEALNYKIIVIQNTTDILKQYRVDELVDILHKMGFRFPFNHNDEAQYHKDLKRVLSRAKSLIVEYNDKAAQLEKISGTRKDNGPIDRTYYDKVLAVLSKFNGYEIDEKRITVSRYISILNVYITHCEQLNAQSHARR